MCTYIHTYMHTCMHTCIHAYMHTCICMYLYIYIYTHECNYGACRFNTMAHMALYSRDGTKLLLAGPAARSESALLRDSPQAEFL